MVIALDEIREWIGSGDDEWHAADARSLADAMKAILDLCECGSIVVPVDVIVQTIAEKLQL